MEDTEAFRPISLDHFRSGAMSRLLRPLILLGLLLPAVACAADVHVMAAGAAKAGVEALLPGFGQADGSSVRASYDTVGALRDRVLEAQYFDFRETSFAAMNGRPRLTAIG